MPGRILVVEDSATNRLILRTRLVQSYYDVIEAESGEEALKLARTESPDLILLDVMMPGIDGLEVCRRLKTDPETQHIPVVLLTALDKQSDKVIGLEAGADDFLSKPFEEVASMSRVASLTRMKMMFDELFLRAATSRSVDQVEMRRVSQATNFPNSTIVMVHDELGSTRELGSLIEKELKCRVKSVEGGEGIHATINSLRTDLIILDGNMGRTDPLRLGSSLRARRNTRQAAILLIVPNNDIELATKALELGFND